MLVRNEKMANLLAMKGEGAEAQGDSGGVGLG